MVRISALEECTCSPAAATNSCHIIAAQSSSVVVVFMLMVPANKHKLCHCTSEAIAPTLEAPVKASELSVTLSNEVLSKETASEMLPIRNGFCCDGEITFIFAFSLGSDGTDKKIHIHWAHQVKSNFEENICSCVWLANEIGTRCATSGASVEDTWFLFKVH